jgi:hypothetical protein
VPLRSDRIEHRLAALRNEFDPMEDSEILILFLPSSSLRSLTNVAEVLPRGC